MDLPHMAILPPSKKTKKKLKKRDEKIKIKNKMEGETFQLALHGWISPTWPFCRLQKKQKEFF